MRIIVDGLDNVNSVWCQSRLVLLVGHFVLLLVYLRFDYVEDDVCDGQCSELVMVRCLVVVDYP